MRIGRSRSPAKTQQEPIRRSLAFLLRRFIRIPSRSLPLARRGTEGMVGDDLAALEFTLSTSRTGWLLEAPVIYGACYLAIVILLFLVGF